MITSTLETNPNGESLAFPRRSPLVPWRYKVPVETNDPADLWFSKVLDPSVVQDETSKKRLAYFHIPFCANHCLFCGFYVNHFEDASANEFANTLINEIALDADNPSIQSRPIQAVYLGGGTPTALSAESLHDLITAIKTHLPLAQDCEITVEGRIFHFTDEKIQACLDAGANRFSIGVQSFNTTVRKKQGRKKPREEVLSFLKNLIARNQATVVIDLLVGLPYQDFDVWKNDIETCIELNPDGVDLYALNIFPSTPLYKAIEKGSIPHAAELKTQLEMYRYGAERLEEAGYYQISNSHWSSNTRERNMYNLHIKDGAEVLAYGSGAGGNLNGFSFTIQKDLEKYKATANSDRKPLDLLFQSDEKQKLRDFITASLEKGRLDTKVFSDRFMISPETKDRLLELINLWKEKGLISKESNGVIWLSISGRFWGPNLISETTELLAPSSRPLPARPNFLKSNS